MRESLSLPRTLATLIVAFTAAACSQSFEPGVLADAGAQGGTDAVAVNHDTGGQMDAGVIGMDAPAASDASAEDASQPADGTVGSDAAEPGPDATVGQDAAQPGEDAAQPGQDAAQPGQDAAQPGQDAAQPAQDAAEPAQDAAQPGQDAAQPGQDAAQPGQDAAQPAPDAAQPAPDAAEPTPDAGFPADATTPDAGFPADSGPPQARLTVSRDGSGGGVVGSSPAGINCGPDCTEDYTLGTVVTLTAAPATGSLFVAWSGACTGTGTCTVTMDQPREVRATFAIQNYPVTVSRLGSGQGTVTSSPPGISCGNTCEARYNYGTIVQLTAAPAMGSVFMGWGGACGGTATTCTVRVESAVLVTATFEAIRFDLITSRTGAGSGTITSNPAGINCGGDCTEPYNYGTMVTLNAQPTGNSVFAGWAGDCTGLAACVVTMTQARAVIARFDPAPRTLTVQVASTGGGASGRVTSVPAGIDCPNDCTESYAVGTQVTLTAMPGPGSTFGAWFGACQGTQPTCTVTMTESRQVFATFDPLRFLLTVTRSGTGNGRVSSNPAGIGCPTDCTEQYAAGTVVALTAAPNPGSTFVGWSGGPCAIGPAADTCRVTMDQARTVNAQFDIQVATLTVRTFGGGTGTVTSNPAGIMCPPDCTEDFTFGTQVALTPTPAAGSGFAGWVDDCSGGGACNVTLSGNRTVGARFDVGLVAWYPFSGNAQDASRNMHNGTSFGVSLTQDRRGAGNSAAAFGLGDYIEVADAADLDGFASMTLCAWVQQERFGTTPAQMYILSKEYLGDNDATTDAYSMRVTAAPAREPLVEVWTTTPGDSTAQQTGGITNLWTHICGVYDGAFLNLYVNSGNTGTDTLTGPVRATAAPLRIGKCGGDIRCDALTWQGALDEVKIWSRALTPGEINEEFTR